MKNRAAQRTRALREKRRLGLSLRDDGVGIVLDHFFTELTVRHAEWIQFFLMPKSEVDVSLGRMVAGALRVRQDHCHAAD